MTSDGCVPFRLFNAYLDQLLHLLAEDELQLTLSVKEGYVSARATEGARARMRARLRALARRAYPEITVGE